MADQFNRSKEIPNRVLADDARTSSNFYESDLILRHYLSKHLDDESLKYLHPRLNVLGKQTATKMDELSLAADKNEPTLIKRSPLGETVNKIDFHPAYNQILKMAVESGMIHLKYDPELKKRFKGVRHMMGFAAGQIFAMGEVGIYCPLCMTDGAAYVLERHAGSELREKLIPRLSSQTLKNLYTGAMFLTEKSGGSDVGRNTTTAEKIDEKTYRLKGEKWFCSNVNADVMLVLARTGKAEEGTRGLSLFVVEKYMQNGIRNPIEIVRLKEKLGVRSMATGEVLLKNTIGIRLGEEGKGFKVMADMINMSRLYNSLTAVASVRRAVIEAWEYLNHRVIFGKRAVEHALIREKFHELGSLHVANFLLVWNTIKKLDHLENGQSDMADAYRTLIPMAKWWSAEISVYVVRECMELMGGNGYIEEFIMPKLLRDVNVLPIWEGSGNVIVLDILRTLKNTDGFKQLIIEMEPSFSNREYGSILQNEIGVIKNIMEGIAEMDREQLEATAKPLFRRFIQLYQMHLMISETDEESEKWINPALIYMNEQITERLSIKNPLSLTKIDNLIGWQLPKIKSDLHQ